MTSRDKVNTFIGEIFGAIKSMQHNRPYKQEVENGICYEHCMRCVLEKSASGLSMSFNDYMKDESK